MAEESDLVLWLRYFTRAVSLWLARKISTRTLISALREHPIAVVGTLGCYIVDPEVRDAEGEVMAEFAREAGREPVSKRPKLISRLLAALSVPRRSAPGRVLFR